MRGWSDVRLLVSAVLRGRRSAPARAAAALAGEVAIGAVERFGGVPLPSPAGRPVGVGASGADEDDGGEKRDEGGEVQDGQPGAAEESNGSHGDSAW